MTFILDKFVPAPAAFRPGSPSEFFAMRLAQKLGDTGAASHYAALLNQHSESHLLIAFRRTIKAGQHPDLGRRFHLELDRVHSNGLNGDGTMLVALRVERRSVAAAIFRGHRLEYTQIRQLSSAKDRAFVSAVGFINWIADSFELDSAALESVEVGDASHRCALHNVIERTLRDQVLPIWMVSKQELLAAYGHPPLKRRKELRAVTTGVWPVLAGTNGKSFIQDAAALGLYVQTERLFLN